MTSTNSPRPPTDPYEGGVAGPRARATDNRDEGRGILDGHTELAGESRLAGSG